MFDDLLELDQTISALDLDLRPSISGYHLISHTQSPHVCVRTWNTSMGDGKVPWPSLLTPSPRLALVLSPRTNPPSIHPIHFLLVI